MLYANVQTGFQPGTFDLFPDTTTEQSELLAFTVGAKNRFLDGQLLLNNEIFYYVFDNLLTQAFDAGSYPLRHLRYRGRDNDITV